MHWGQIKLNFLHSCPARANNAFSPAHGLLCWVDTLLHSTIQNPSIHSPTFFSDFDAKSQRPWPQNDTQAVLWRTWWWHVLRKGWHSAPVVGFGEIWRELHRDSLDRQHSCLPQPIALEWAHCHVPFLWTSFVPKWHQLEICQTLTLPNFWLVSLYSVSRLVLQLKLHFSLFQAVHKKKLAEYDSWKVFRSHYTWHCWESISLGVRAQIEQIQHIGEHFWGSVSNVRMSHDLWWEWWHSLHVFVALPTIHRFALRSLQTPWWRQRKMQFSCTWWGQRKMQFWWTLFEDNAIEPILWIKGSAHSDTFGTLQSLRYDGFSALPLTLHQVGRASPAVSRMHLLVRPWILQYP